MDIPPIAAVADFELENEMRERPTHDQKEREVENEVLAGVTRRKLSPEEALDKYVIGPLHFNGFTFILEAETSSLVRLSEGQLLSFHTIR